MWSRDMPPMVKVTWLRDDRQEEMELRYAEILAKLGHVRYDAPPAAPKQVSYEEAVAQQRAESQTYETREMTAKRRGRPPKER